LALATGASQNAVATLSNLAGGLVCEKVGVVPITTEMLLSELK
jgi:bifunctional ADP-heptose synthase (sugar kinase/adenylyltransferase)